MTRWAGFWLKTARKYFPESDIQIVTGGISNPKAGADFSAQAKVASLFNGGIRITNQNDDYEQSFILTRLAASACKNYKASFSTEESGINKAYGVTMRIFDGVTTGVSGLYFKNIIQCGHTPCGKAGKNIGTLSRGAENLIAYYDFLSLKPSPNEIAIFYPNIEVAINPGMKERIWYRCRQLRRFLDFDMIDEQMVMDRHILNYRFLLVLQGGWISADALSIIFSWIKKGGILIFSGQLNFKPIDNPTLETARICSCMKRNMKLGNGYIYHTEGPQITTSITEAVQNRKKGFAWTGIPAFTNEITPRFFATRFNDKVIGFDPKLHCIRIFYKS